MPDVGSSPRSLTWLLPTAWLTGPCITAALLTADLAIHLLVWVLASPPWHSLSSGTTGGSVPVVAKGLGSWLKGYLSLGPGTAAAAAKSHQSCPTLYDPKDGSPPDSPVPGILQARTLEWVAISFSNAWKWKVKMKSLSHVWLLATPWTVAYQASPSMGFPRQEYWSGVPLPSLEIIWHVLNSVYFSGPFSPFMECPLVLFAPPSCSVFYLIQ